MTPRSTLSTLRRHPSSYPALHPFGRPAGAARLGLALAAIAAGCGSPAGPAATRPAGQPGGPPASATSAPSAPPEAPAGPAAATSDTCPPLADPAGWFGLGGSGPADDGVRAVAGSGGGGLATAPALSSAATGFDAKERPLSAWVQDQGVRVRRREAHGWEPLGASDRDLGVRAVGADGPTGARLRDGFGVWSPAIAGLGADDVMVAWVEGAPPWQGRVRAARWSGGAWRDAMPGSGPARSPAVMCARWDVEFGAGAEPPVLHIDPTGRITAACMQPIGDPRTMPRIEPSSGPIARLVLQVWQWDGRRWRTLPATPLYAAGADGGARGPMTSVIYGHGIALATDDAGAPVVLHGAIEPQAAGASGSAHARTRWQRLHWQPARRTWRREEVTAPAGAALLALAPTSQGPQPLWRDAGGLGIGDQTARVPLPPLLAGPRHPHDPLASFALAVAASPAGKLAIATATRVGIEMMPHTLHVHVWDGAVWSDPGATHRSSGVSGGVSATPSTSRQPALALDACGRPAVAWIEMHAGGSDVYLRRWTGRAWEALAGSAEGGGVSASGRALAASVAVDAAGAPMVLWWEQPETAAPRPRSVLRARRFGDGRWIDVAAPELLDNTQLALSDTWLDIDPAGAPVAAVPVVGAQSVLLLRRQGPAWQYETRGGAGAGGTWRFPALGPDGVLRAFWLEPDGARVIAGAWRDGWQVERTLAHGAGAISEAAAVRDDAGRVYLAWTRAGVWPAELSVSVSGSVSGPAPGAATAGADALAPLSTGSPANSAAHAREPAIAVGARVCVAWSELGADGSEIYLRCHAPGQPGQPGRPGQAP